MLIYAIYMIAARSWVRVRHRVPVGYSRCLLCTRLRRRIKCCVDPYITYVSCITEVVLVGNVTTVSEVAKVSNMARDTPWNLLL